MIRPGSDLLLDLFFFHFATGEVQHQLSQLNLIDVATTVLVSVVKKLARVPNIRGA